jgi:hypothetical protein
VIVYFQEQEFQLLLVVAVVLVLTPLRRLVQVVLLTEMEVAVVIMEVPQVLLMVLDLLVVLKPQVLPNMALLEVEALVPLVRMVQVVMVVMAELDFQIQ